MSHGNQWSIVIATWLLWSSPAFAATFEVGNALLQDCIQEQTLILLRIYRRYLRCVDERKQRKRI